ncbi:MULTISPECIES: thiamine pyrophosphate-dependent enzyme [unclassified Mesorhizobium]|uniref:thiamine pyrophosphate-dependent enzyme n=1 Tax=unclassified Mesorhizobium TaxID=325217 RepID=UPI000FD238D4|nr:MULTISPECIES: thiamine pyrophosphate-dependent enzyme [unclassified Mesorhizobium]RUX02031.1 pyruvate oxidase [Mesorhizobium sp. M8A.F.Ca.ET.023.01.1.1]RVD59691.1 pyruvate oxidase [Mesorhizobium sp. M8A.F.Ca.ET.023.02.2.1]RWC70370.1 MAG: pyruvate oxidase [Mesorhizobium sp.]TGR58204.1 pyruvate oxidase [bacterium M00.F.Ca.ET.199.01.1.1]TGU41688.1 pyruvate oxidase [bacterium M00.F.Ca.ET.156.01.1.1]TGU93121.1 pyruvate oxidase [Mesorhizobium sp. M00.F.Ca.ET.151.01.1.1]TGV15991.1 pyruvate oxida
MSNAAEILIETLIAWNVEVVFGLPGDGINGIMEALRTRRGKIKFIQVRHEESAAFMACAYAKWTGKLGVCLATSGPGGTHLLTGLYDAKLDQAPVLAITGMQFHDLIETFTQQDVDLTRVFNDVAVYNVQVSDAAHMENVASLACRTALARKGVAHLSIASDTQEQESEPTKRSKRNRPEHTPQNMFTGHMVAQDVELDKAAAVLNEAPRVAILAGRGALGAASELERTAQLLQAPVAKALLGKAVLPDDHPYTTGGIGILGTLASQDMMENCDAVLIVGSTFPYIEYYPKPGQARGVQIDCDAQRIGLRFPVEAGLVGDAAETLRALNRRLTQKPSNEFLLRAQDNMGKWREMMRQSEDAQAHPVKPQLVVRAFGERLASNTVLATDSGQNTELAARHVDLREGQAFGLSGALASMSCGLAYAIAAGIAFPGRPVAAIVGDGGLAMQLGEFSTAVRYGVPLKLLVLKNNMLNQIAWEQMMFLGNPQFGCELAPIDFAKAAEAMGAKGLRIDRADQIEAVLDEAFAVDGPVIVEALVDAYEPMMPPKMPSHYARNFRKALPQTPGHEQIEENIAREPARSMMDV